MGTRCLVAIFHQGKHAVTHVYNSGGQPFDKGAQILNFLNNSFDRELCIKNLNVFQLVSPNEKASFLKLPYLLKILNCILLENYEHSSIKIEDSLAFAGDVMCNWGYVIDLDKNTFEVYKSNYGRKKLPESERFSYLSSISDTYNSYRSGALNRFTPIKLFKKYSLFKLPEMDKFIKDNC